MEVLEQQLPQLGDDRDLYIQ